MKKIGLDAGHGLYTNGKQTPDGIKEWTLNDDVCDMITEILRGYDCKIIRTDNDEGKVDEPLSERVNRYIKEGVSAFVSIHHNAYTGNWNNVSGVEVYTDRTPTAADERLAKIIYGKLISYTALKGRGIKQANFQIINQNKVPAVLVEGGFMDSSTDYRIITSAEGKRNYAKAVAEGLIEFLGLKKETVSEKPSVIYQVWEDVKNKWLPNVKDDSDYAGNLKNAICCVKANLTKGNIYYRVHIIGSKTNKPRWLPEVKNREDYAGNYNQPIDGLAIRTDTGYTVCYSVHEKKSGRWLPEVTGCNISDSIHGYAGNFGREIDAVKIYFK